MTILDKLFYKIQSLPFINKVNLKYEFRFWLNFSAFTLMTIWFFVAIFTTDYKLPIWALHTITGHHIYDLLFSFTIPFYYLWIKKGLRPLWAFIIIAFVIAVNEIAWWITYFVSHYILGNNNYYLPNGVTHSYLFWSALKHLTIYNSELYGYIIIIALFLYSFKIKPKAFLLWFIVLILIYVYWLSIGFPITIDFSGNTILYLDFNTNMIENLHWIIPVSLLIIFYDRLFEQNSNLLGLPPFIFKLYFKGSSFKEYQNNIETLITLEHEWLKEKVT